MLLSAPFDRNVFPSMHVEPFDNPSIKCRKDAVLRSAWCLLLSFSTKKKAFAEIQRRPKMSIKKWKDLSSNTEAKCYILCTFRREQETTDAIWQSRTVFFTSVQRMLLVLSRKTPCPWIIKLLLTILAEDRLPVILLTLTMLGIVTWRCGLDVTLQCEWILLGPALKWRGQVLLEGVGSFSVERAFHQCTHNVVSRGFSSPWCSLRTANDIKRDLINLARKGFFLLFP